MINYLACLLIFCFISGFLYSCGVVYIVATTLVAIFKQEKETKSVQEWIPEEGTDDSMNMLIPKSNGEFEILPSVATTPSSVAATPHKCLSLWQTYRVMLGILQLVPVLRYIGFLFITKFVFSATDSVFTLKLLEHGVSKERIALMCAFILPLEAFLPLLVTRWTNGPRPLTVYLNAAIPRALISLSAVVIVYHVDYFREPANAVDELNNLTQAHDVGVSFPANFYIILLCQLVIYATFSHTMFVSQMAFHARVSDPNIGGTYMTLLNTASNLGNYLFPLSSMPKTSDANFLKKIS